METVIRNEVRWMCQTVGLNGTNGMYSGDQFGTSVDRSGMQWFKLQVGSEGSSLNVVDHGRVFDSVRVTNVQWYHYPSLVANCVGDMVAGFSGSSATNYINAFYTWHLSNGGAPEQLRLLRAGTISHSGSWGDYSATVLDPADDWVFWTVQAYSAPYFLINTNKQHWSTVVAKIRPAL